MKKFRLAKLATMLLAVAPIAAASLPCSFLVGEAKIPEKLKNK